MSRQMAGGVARVGASSSTTSTRGLWVARTRLRISDCAAVQRARRRRAAGEGSGNG